MIYCKCTTDIEVINDSENANPALCGFCDKPKMPHTPTKKENDMKPLKLSGRKTEWSGTDPMDSQDQHSIPAAKRDEGMREHGEYTPTHTPTPWNLEDRTGTIVDAIGGPIAKVVALYETLGGSTPEAQANAAYIVRAVNAHEELLTLLKSVTTVKLMYDDPELTGRILNAIARAEHSR